MLCSPTHTSPRHGVSDCAPLRIGGWGGHTQVLTTEDREERESLVLTGSQELVRGAQEQQPTEGFQDHGGGLSQAAEPRPRRPGGGSAQLPGAEARRGEVHLLQLKPASRVPWTKSLGDGWARSSEPSFRASHSQMDGESMGRCEMLANFSVHMHM